MIKWKDKNPQEKLESFQRLNKVEKLKKAELEGFKNTEVFRVHLKGQWQKWKAKGGPVVAPKPIQVKTTLKKPIIHNVHILDSSGSMRGGKFNNAEAGIKKEIELLRKDESVTYLQTFAYFKESKPFIQNLGIELKHFEYPVEISTHNNTPLYKTIIEVLSKLIVKKDTKILVKIFTDGRDNDFSGYSRSCEIDKCKNLITSMQSYGVTITFVGTKEDVAHIVGILEIDESNTLAYDNTAKGVEEAFTKTIVATQNYTDKVKKGEDTKFSFYKEIL